MHAKTLKVSKIVRELHDQIGGAIPIDDILERADEEDLSEEEVMESLGDLEMDGIISKIDDETIEFM